MYSCFRSAADIVSGAYPMPSRRVSVCLSVRPPAVNLFFKSNRLSQFSSDLSDIWVECAQQYCPTSCGSRILINRYIYIILMDLQLLKKSCRKWEFWRFFWSFYQNVLLWDHETWFTCILWVLSCVCKKWSLWAKFSGPFWSIWDQNKQIDRFSSIFLKIFLWIHSKLDS